MPLTRKPRSEVVARIANRNLQNAVLTKTNSLTQSIAVGPDNKNIKTERRVDRRRFFQSFVGRHDA
jgi:hypothetical protein